MSFGHVVAQLLVSGCGGLGLIPGQSAWYYDRQSGTGLGLLRVLQFSVIIIILSLLHTHLSLMLYNLSNC